MVDLAKYELGDLDAWKDQRALARVFVPTEQFSELPELHRCFLSGRRGSGKSAIAIMAQSQEQWDAAYVIQGERSQYGAYMDLVDDLVSRERAGLRVDVKRFVHVLWRYCLQILILQKAAEFATARSLAASAIQEFLWKHRYQDADMGPLLHRLFQEAMLQSGLGPAAIFGYLQERLNDNGFKSAINAISETLGTSRILIVLDTIESYRIHEQSMVEGLRGVVGAIIGLLSEDKLRSVGIRFFIPAEIFDQVAAEIPAKIVANTVFLRWRTGDLIRMLAKRYITVLKTQQLLQDGAIERLTQSIDAIETTASSVDGAQGKALRQEFWYNSKLLPDRIQNRRNMAEDTFGYLLRHTQRRPRELIFVMNQIARKAAARGELPFISEKSVIEGIHDPKTLQLLVAEALSPFEGYVDRIMDRARSAFTGRPRTFDFSELKRFAKAFYDLGAVHDIQPERFLEFLVRSGVVGIVTSRSASSPYLAAHFEYLMQGHLLLGRGEYCVHPALGDCFGMAPVAPHKSIYPIPEDDLWLEDEIGVRV